MGESTERTFGDQPALFRKSAFDRVFSPEDLDQVVTISASGSWTVVSALLLLCAAATAWSISARLPTTMAGSGLIVGTGGGLLDVTAPAAGAVGSVDVAVGDRVTAGQVLATLTQSELARRIEALTYELDQLRLRQRRDLERRAAAQRLQLGTIAQQRLSAERALEALLTQVHQAEAQLSLVQRWSDQGLVGRQQLLTEQWRAAELNREVETRRAVLAQLDVQELAVRSNALTPESEIAVQILERERALAAAQQAHTLHEVVTAPYAGEVLEIRVARGSVVAENMSLLTIQPDTSVLEVLAYVPSRQAKSILAGMTARVVPSTVRRAEYGYMQGRVSSVAAYPATSAALMHNLHNEQLVQSLTSNGPITEVHVALDLDPHAPSGFRWSSSGGPPLKISAGTFAAIEVVTETRAPITLVLPVLRRALGF